MSFFIFFLLPSFFCYLSCFIYFFVETQLLDVEYGLLCVLQTKTSFRCNVTSFLVFFWRGWLFDLARNILWDSFLVVSGLVYPFLSSSSKIPFWFYFLDTCDFLLILFWILLMVCCYYGPCSCSARLVSKFNCPYCFCCVVRVPLRHVSSSVFIHSPS